MRFAASGALLFAILAAAACERPATAIYDADTRLVHRIDYDADRDGRVEMRLYYAGGRPARLEADGNGDGRIDRREEYAGDGSLARLGTASLQDGRVDTWVTTTSNTMRIDISTRRDGLVDRREFHENGVVQRAELDTNVDGRVDQWQQFDAGRLRTLAFDSTLQAGRPDRRLVYIEEGTRLEADIDGDGQFTEVADAAP